MRLDRMSNVVSIRGVTEALETLTDDERAALRASRFHSEPAPAPSTRRSRLAHPGGALATNKMVALEKFLKKRLDEGSLSLDPDLVRNAVDNAKASSRSGLSAACESVRAASVRHVDSFSGSDKDQSEDLKTESENRKKKRKPAQKLVKEGSDGSSKSESKTKKSKKTKMDAKTGKRRRAEAGGRKIGKGDKIKCSSVEKKHKHNSKKK